MKNFEDDYNYQALRDAYTTLEVDFDETTSVAQLVGYDRNENEVYEGDTLNNIYGGTDFHIAAGKDRTFVHAFLN